MGTSRGSAVKESAGNARDMSLILCQEDSLEEEMTTYSSILVWKIPWQRTLVGFSLQGRKGSDMIEHACTGVLNSRSCCLFYI